MTDGALQTWETRQRGDRPVVPVSCLTPKYAETESVMVIYQNDSIFRLPGNGESKERCGEWVHPLSCPNYGQPTIEGKQHDRFVVQHSCHSPDCPICYESWASREAQRASDRIIQALELYRKAGINFGKVKHIVFSPTQDEAKRLIRTREGFRNLKKQAIKIFKKGGVKAGAVIFHPFRQNDPREDNYNPDMPDMIWYLSPHFHVIGCGYLQKSDEFYNETGWIYNNIGRRETIKGTIKYTLTHCGIADGFQALTYFGAFSYNKVVIDEKIKIEEPVKCQVCGEYLHEYALIEKEESLEPDWKQDLGVYYHVVIKRTYKLKGLPKTESKVLNLEQRRLLE